MPQASDWRIRMRPVSWVKSTSPARLSRHMQNMLPLRLFSSAAQHLDDGRSYTAGQKTTTSATVRASDPHVVAAAAPMRTLMARAERRSEMGLPWVAMRALDWRAPSCRLGWLGLGWFYRNEGALCMERERMKKRVWSWTVKSSRRRDLFFLNGDTKVVAALGISSHLVECTSTRMNSKFIKNSKIIQKIWYFFTTNMFSCSTKVWNFVNKWNS